MSEVKFIESVSASGTAQLAIHTTVKTNRSYPLLVEVNPKTKAVYFGCYKGCSLQLDAEATKKLTEFLTKHLGE